MAGCLAAGGRGVKLHPRAERFDLRHPGVASVFAAAAEHRLPVIIHAGLGIPSLGCDALRLAERYPGTPLILAHLGVTDLAWIWRHLGHHPSLFFDTAWWNPADHLALFAHVPPGRILLGSDAPFGTPAAAAIVAIRCALQAGLTPTQIQAVTGGQLQHLLAGDDPADLGLRGHDVTVAHPWARPLEPSGGQPAQAARPPTDGTGSGAFRGGFQLTGIGPDAINGRRSAGRRHRLAPGWARGRRGEPLSHWEIRTAWTSATPGCPAKSFPHVSRFPGCRRV